MNTTDKAMELVEAYADAWGANRTACRKELRAKIEALARDAERHRFMRNSDLDEMAAKYWPDGEVPTGDEYDAAVDAAMQEKQS